MSKSFFTFDFSTVGGSSSYDDNSKTKRQSYKPITKFGKTVYWLDGRHFDKDKLEQHRMIGDVEMDHLLEAIRQTYYHDSSCTRMKPSFRFLDVVDACSQLYEKNLEGKSNTDSHNRHINETERLMIAFYDKHHNDIPEELIDWEQIQRGIDVFISYAPVMGLSLYYLSLVPGFSIPKIAQVLLATKYLAPPSTNKQVKQRLFDTGGFMASCMIDHNSNNEDGDETSNSNSFASSLKPGGIGWKMALRVRVLHGKVRQGLLKREHWDVSEFGIPINQEDMVATLLAFSVNPLNGVEYMANKPLSRREQLDYLALWRYIGWLLGILATPTKEGVSPLNPCGDGSCGVVEDPIIHSRALLESIILHLMHPNNLSAEISNHLLRVGQSPRNDIFLGYLYRCYMCRRIIGCELADALRIPALALWPFNHLVAYLLSMVMLFSLRIYTLLTMYSALFKRLAYKRHIRMMNHFYYIWVKENKLRMESLARKSNTSTITMKEEEKTQNRITLCPFSLIMPVLEITNEEVLKSKKMQ